MGLESDAQIRAEMGVYEDAALQQYVSRIGLQLARMPGHPGGIDDGGVAPTPAWKPRNGPAFGSAA